MFNDFVKILDNIVWNIYVTPLWFIVLAMIFMISIWASAGALGTKKFPSFWKFLNIVLLLCSIGGILFVTVFNRDGISQAPDLIPFSFIEKAKYNTETYRSVLMNVFLFVPFGLSASFSFGRKNVTRTFFSALLLSIAIELIQYFFSLGMMATDDVLANCLGAFLGTLAFAVVNATTKSKKRKKHRK